MSSNLWALLFLVPLLAQGAECTLYEKSHPAFALTGAHLSTGKCSNCATCHIQGIFTGTPKSCVSCHNGDPTRLTVGRSASHVPTLLVECSYCHNTSTFTTATMNHTIMASSRCDSCHNGSYASSGARGKPKEHPKTTADCRTCHSTRNWDT